jgi:hypothetical protein
MKVDVCSRTYSFAFAPGKIGSFSPTNSEEGEEPFLQGLCADIFNLTTVAETRPKGLEWDSLKAEFSPLFSSSLGTAKCIPYDIELSDTTPVRSPPYRCAPPKLEMLKRIVNELLEQGVIRPSKSQYASPAFLMPKGEGGFRLVVDYRKVNSKIVFDSYPMPTIEQAFEQFAGAAIFSVLDLNSAYFQIPLTPSSRRVMAFCNPFGLMSSINSLWGLVWEVRA